VRLFTKGDLDGFFGLMVDNLVQVLVILALCTSPQICGLPEWIVFKRILPGIAVSLLVGNVYYALHAWQVARRDKNPTCTALPYGINTVTMFAFITLIMAPVYHQNVEALGPERAGTLAWRVGLMACLVSGLVELLGAFFGERVRRATPRAALLSTLAAIAVAFIASDFGYRIFQRPVIGIVPLAVVLLVYFSRVRFPLGLPGGLVAVLLGTLLAWAAALWSEPLLGLNPPMHVAAVRQAIGRQGWLLPVFCGRELLAVLQPEFIVRFLGVTVPLGLLSALGSLQNIESAAAAGDRFRTGPCLAVNGIGTLAAALFGSCFPTSIYIGHPGWKALGARAGYSLLNGAFFTVVFLAGLGPLIGALIPIEAGAAIVLWIGIVMAAQAYEATPVRHFAAVAIGFFPAIAAWVVIKLEVFYRLAGGQVPLARIVAENPDGYMIGMYALAGANSGFILTCMLLSAISAHLIDRRFRSAAIWSLLAAGLTVIGLQHAFRLEAQPPVRELMIWQWHLPAGTFAHRGFGIAIGYVLAALLFLGIERLQPTKAATPPERAEAPPANEAGSEP